MLVMLFYSSTLFCSNFCIRLLDGIMEIVLNDLGFLCPVHTPDGAPCGLLNHMTAACQVCLAN